MKQLQLITSALLLSFPLVVQAGTDTKDMKDMKDTKQMAEAVSDAGFYVAAEGGAQFATSYGNDHETISGTSTGTLPPGSSQDFSPSNFHSQWGGVGGLRGGYNFESFPVCSGLRLQPAAELEALYIGDETDFNGTFRNTFGRLSVPTQASEHFTSNSGAMFINGILRLKTDWCINPYFGAGVGGQYITTHGDSTLTSPVGDAHVTGVNGSDLDFAFQVLVGFDYTINKHWSIFTEYKFVDAIGSDLKSDENGYGVTTRLKPDELQQHLVVAGVKYGF